MRKQYYQVCAKSINYPHFMGLARINLALQVVPALYDIVISN